jgi:hypothetical protein
LGPPIHPAVSHSNAGVLAGYRKDPRTIVVALARKSLNSDLRDSIRFKSLDQPVVVVLTLIFVRNKPNKTGSTRHYVHIKEGLKKRKRKMPLACPCWAI